MDTARRAWIYSGLALAEDVGLVVPSTPEQPKLLAPPWGLAVFGDELATGLATPLRQLAGTEYPFGLRAHDNGMPWDWLHYHWMRDFVAGQRRPTLFLGAFKSGYGTEHSDFVMKAIEVIATAADGAVAWLGPPGQSILGYGTHLSAHHLFPSDDLEIQFGPDGVHPSAAGFAGWAGAIWSWLT